MRHFADFGLSKGGIFGHGGRSSQPNIYLVYNSYLGFKPLSERRKRKTRIEAMKMLEIGSRDLMLPQ